MTTSYRSKEKGTWCTLFLAIREKSKADPDKPYQSIPAHREVCRSIDSALV